MITNKYKVSLIKSVHPRGTAPPRSLLTRLSPASASASPLLTLQPLLYRTLRGPHGLRPVATMYTPHSLNADRLQVTPRAAYPADGGARW